MGTPAFGRFNQREVEILTMIADGLSNREIAQKLYLSQETIKWYNKQIFAKLGVSSRTQAVSVAKKHRLIVSAHSSYNEKKERPSHHSSATITFVQQNRYTLSSVLGRGGMGTVYQARDTLLNRNVAIKFLSGDITEENRSSLLREARSSAQLNHPNIVSVYDVGEMQGIPFILMELVEGESLYSHKPLNQDEIIDITLQICAALEHAHANGIIHRDLKPENIILTPQGNVKLLDFGLARSIASRISTQGGMIGTVYYMAPEYALGKTVDGRADLYSLGVILYELLAGRLPFPGEDPLAVISQHLHAPVVPPSTHQPAAISFDPIILRLLAKNPDDRFASAYQVIEALSMLREAKSSVTLPELSGPVAQLNQLARGRLVGRRSELNKLLEYWKRSQQGLVHLILLSGEPGIGKTRLGNELVVNAQLNGAVVLRGGCYEYEATTPYLPFGEALREWIHGQTSGSVRDLLGSTANELARLAPEIESKLGPLAQNPTLSPNEERLRLFDNVTRFLQTLSGKKGLLLFIDDLHWADQGTLSLLYYILRNLHNDRVMILAAYREMELDRSHPLAAALVEWNRERLAIRIPLNRLTFEDSSTMLATLFGQESVSEDYARAMYAETEGNPFFIEEVVKTLIEQGTIYRKGSQWGRKDIAELAMPQGVKEAIGRRLSRLSQACLDILHVASALGKEFDFRELAATNLMDEDQLLDMLDEASQAQLLRPSSGESYSFTHDKIREVLYEELNLVRRKRLHQRIGEGLEKRYSGKLEAHIQELAHHFTHSGDLPRSLRYSILAAEKTHRLYALDDALHYYEYAREAAEMLNETAQLALIHNAIGEIYSQRGPINLAVEHYEQAIALEPDTGKRGAIKAQIGSVYAEVGDARGLGYIEEALQELDAKTQTREVALATAMIGRYYHYQTQHWKAIEYLDRARKLAEPLEDPLSLSSIYAYLAGAYNSLANFKVSMEWAQKNITLGLRMNYPLSAALGYEFMAEDSFAMGDWQATLEFAALEREIAEKIGAQDRLAWATLNRAEAEYGLGNLEAAARDSLDTRSLSQNIGDTRCAILAGGLAVQVLSDLDKNEEAGLLAEQVLQEVDSLQHVFYRAWIRHYVAYSFFHQRKVDRALELYTQAEELVRPTENLLIPLIYRSTMAEALFESGRIAEAGRLATEALEMARASTSRHNEALALRVQGRVFAASARWDEALAAIQESILILKELSSKVELARSLDCHSEIQQFRGKAQAIE